MSDDGVASILLEYFAPDAVGNILLKVARFLQGRRTDRTTDMVRAEFDISRRKAEPKVQIGGASHDAHVPVLRMQNASESRPAKSVILARVRGSLFHSVCGETDAPTILASADLAVSSEERSQYEASLAYRRAKKLAGNERRRMTLGAEIRERLRVMVGPWTDSLDARASAIAISSVTESITRRRSRILLHPHGFCTRPGVHHLPRFPWNRRPAYKMMGHP